MYPWCVLRLPDARGVEKAGILEAAKWPLDTRIKVGFLDGDPSLRNRVMDVAQEWLSRTGARLSFERRNDAGVADIRISFQLEGSWSYLGRHCQRIPRDKPTMNFGWLGPDSPEAGLRAVVLHEFGHALGFIHEHQNPDGGIGWNRDRVIHDLSGPPNHWSAEEIERNVFNGYDRRELLATPYDGRSIMLYAFPPEWTLNGLATTTNQDLSADDIALARRVYRG